MTAEEALVIVETALDYDRLNKVQEIVFRQSWEGRSYAEIAKSADYEVDYIKDAGAKLWKLLSKALGEKVKKDNLQSVLKRYLRRNHITLHQTHVIGVHLSGGTLSEANLTGAKLFANSGQAESCQADLYRERIPSSGTELDQENLSSRDENNQGVQSKPEDRKYYWNGWHFCSEEEVEIAEALDRAGVLFIPKSRIRMTTSEGKQNQQPDFLIFSQGKWGILQVWHEDEEKDRESAIAELQIFQSHGIQTVQNYYASRCQIEPDRVVQEFLETLTSADIIQLDEPCQN